MATVSTYLTDILGASVFWQNDASAVAKLSTLGVKWLRRDLRWANVEAVQGVYNFSTYDVLVNTAEAAGMKVLFILDYGNTIHTGAPANPPRTANEIAAYCEYCRRAAIQYANRPVIFELWNEPDLDGFWPPKANAVEYSTLLKAAIPAIRAGNPNAFVLTGGLSKPRDFSTGNALNTYAMWATMESEGALVGYSAVGTHLYTEFYNEEPEIRAPDIIKINAYSERNTGRGAWCTEWGHPSAVSNMGNDGTSAIGRHWQAIRLVRSVLTGWVHGLSLFIIYNDKDTGTDPVSSEQNFGMVDTVYADKPAYTAMATLTASVTNRAYVRHEWYGDVRNGAALVETSGVGGRCLIAWPWGASAIDVSMPTGSTVKNVYGQNITPASLSGRLRIGGGMWGGPIYIFPPS